MASLAINSFKAVCDKLNSEASTASLPDVAKVYAKMSQEAYENPKKRADMVGGFMYLEEHSNQLVGVYYLPDKNLYVIAIKGTGHPTELAGLKEIFTDDARIFLGNTLFRGLFPKVFTNLLHGTALEGTNSVARGVVGRVAGGQAKLHVTGHSLGAWVAIELAKKHKDIISGGHVFNAGSNPFRKIAGIFEQAAWAWFSDDILHGEFYHHHIFGDMLSCHYKKLPRNQTTIYTDKSWNPLTKHGIDNFAEQYDKNWEFPLTWFSKSTHFSQM